MDNKWIDESLIAFEKKYEWVVKKNHGRICYTTDESGSFDDRSGDSQIGWWTNGFWGGLMWLMYEATGNEDYKKTALRSEEIEDKAFEDVEKLSHDVGFMWHILAGANYRLTGNAEARNKNLFCAMSLMSRYNVEGDYIRSWNNWSKEDNTGWTIIDCMMNIPLLYCLNRDWYDALMNTVFGKIVLAICGVVIIITAIRMNKLTKPIEYKR